MLRVKGCCRSTVNKEEQIIDPTNKSICRSAYLLTYHACMHGCKKIFVHV